MSNTRALIDAMAEGNAEAIETAFNSAMADRIMDRIETLRKDVAQNMFKEQPDVVDEELEQIDEVMTRKHFQQVADVIKSHPDQEKRNELAKHHAEIFKKSNPRFDHGRFYKAAGANINEELDEGVWKQDVEKAFPASGVKTGASAPKGTSTMPKDKEKAKGQPAGALRKEESMSIDEEINEVLGKDATAGDWISDFIKSDNPKFQGKSKDERKRMALGAYYAAHPEKSNK